MGHRGAYRVRDGDDVGPYIRQQWAITGDEEEIRELVRSVAETLCTDYSGETQQINSGGVALRHDLFVGRLSAALIDCLYSRPFQSVTTGVPADISNAGIFEIQLIEWNRWQVNHIPVTWDSDNGDTVHHDRAELLASVSFEDGAELENGMNFRWHK